MNITEFCNQYKTHPVLFVGTGISMRYYSNSKSWEELLKEIVIDYSGSEEHYYDLKSQCLLSTGRGYDYPKLGGIVEKEFNTVASSDRDGKYKEVNDSFYELMRNGQQISRFKILISTIFAGLILREGMEVELGELKKARKNVGSVITTNYDDLIERVFEFNPLIGNDILLSNPYGSVYKIHGCLNHPGHIIITSDDYDNFESRYELIRAQLLSLFIHNPIVFLGYNMGDDNIKKILKTIFAYVVPNTDLAEQIKKNFLLVEYCAGSDNIQVQEHDIDIGGVTGTIRINKLKTDNFVALYQAISGLNLPISAMDVRKVQTIVKEIYAGGSIKVEITEDIDKLKNSDRILAIGSSKTISYQYLTLTEMTQKYFDILDESNSALLSTINKQKVASNQYFPVFGFSLVNEDINDIEILKEQQKSIITKYLAGIGYKRANSHTAVEDILNDESIATSYKCQSLMYAVDKAQISLNDYEHFLRHYPDNRDSSDYRRMICQYDLMKYGSFENYGEKKEVPPLDEVPFKEMKPVIANCQVSS